MKNFDYLKPYEHLADLYAYCQTAELKQVSDPEKSALNGRKAVEWLVRNIYRMKNIEADTSMRETIAKPGSNNSQTLSK